MPLVSLEARLLQASLEIRIGQWFLVYPDDTIRLIPAAQAKTMLPPSHRPRIDGIPVGVTFTQGKALVALANAKAPISGVRWNKSGILSQLKAKGYVTNSAGKWAITDSGRQLLAQQEEPTNDQ